MKRRTLLAFVVLNVVVSVAVTYTVATMISEGRPQPTPISPPTVVVYITNTAGPTQTPIVQIVTATPDPRVLVPAQGGEDEAPGEEEAATEGPTETPTLTDAELTSTAAAVAELETHTVQSGEYFGLIAETYGVSVADLLCQNGLTEDDLIYPGDVLVIPGPEGCTYNAEAAETPVREAAAGTATRTPLPTITLQPTAANAQVRIASVLAPGDITAEEVTLINDGGLIDLTGWTLYDRQGNTFVFPETRLFPGGSMTVRTRRGDDTAIVRHWGLSSAVWGEEGDAVTLADKDGAVQSIYVIGRPGTATPTAP